jgi:DHA1 family tetracycline resistance protein-like MFS transporter
LVSPTEQGQLQGANASLIGIAELVGPGMFTQAFARFVDATGGFRLPGAPFLLAALILAASTILAWRVTRPDASPR